MDQDHPVSGIISKVVIRLKTGGRKDGRLQVSFQGCACG